MGLSLKEKVLKERGLVEQQGSVGQHKRLVTIPKSNLDHLKTPHMKYLEMGHKKPIEQLLLAGSLSMVAKKLDIDRSTASRWIKKLNLRYSETNLPSCDGCSRYRKSCEVGLCPILIDIGRWDLVNLKQKEMYRSKGII